MPKLFQLLPLLTWLTSVDAVVPTNAELTGRLRTAGKVLRAHQKIEGENAQEGQLGTQHETSPVQGNPGTVAEIPVRAAEQESDKSLHGNRSRDTYARSNGSVPPKRSLESALLLSTEGIRGSSLANATSAVQPAAAATHKRQYSVSDTARELIGSSDGAKKMDPAILAKFADFADAIQHNYEDEVTMENQQVEYKKVSDKAVGKARHYEGVLSSEKEIIGKNRKTVSDLRNKLSNHLTKVSTVIGEKLTGKAGRRAAD